MNVVPAEVESFQALELGEDSLGDGGQRVARHVQDFETLAQVGEVVSVQLGDAVVCRKT